MTLNDHLEISWYNDPRHKQFGDYNLNLADKTVTARERIKTKFVPNPLDAVVMRHFVSPP